MISRRSLLLGAAAVAASTTSACALPARLLEDDAAPLDLVPCDGRVLPISQYFDLFNVLRDTYGSTHGLHNAFAFRVPDFRARIVASPEPISVLPVDKGIVAARDLIWPVGTILNMPGAPALEEVLRSISAEAHELNRRHRLHVRGMLHG